MSRTSARPRCPDPDTGRVSGIVDFEDAVGDPTFDFSGVFDLAPGILALYHGPRDPCFERLIRFYRWLWPIREACYGIEVGSAKARDRCLASLRAAL